MTQIVNQEYIVNKLQESLDKDAVVKIKSRDKAFKHLGRLKSPDQDTLF